MDISLILESPLVQALAAAGIFLVVLYNALGALRVRTMKKYQDLVGKAVAEFRNPSEGSVARSYEVLSVIPLDELLAELSVRIEEITYGQDVPRLIAAARLPLPENPEALVDIVHRNDLTALHGYVDGDLAKLVASIIMLIASLEEVRARAG